MGGYPTVSLAMARERAAAARRLIAEGGDPFAERRKESEPTFGETAARYVQSMQGQWRNRKTLGEWTTALARHCTSIWDMRVSEVDVPAVLAVLTPMWSKIPTTAARVRNRIEAILDYAKAHGWRTGENPARWKGGMSHLLPKRDKAERPHHAAMDYHDVPTFMTRLRGVRTMTARALEITVLTALRSGEVRSANWDEIDFDNAVWTLPANRMKAHRQHVVPLSSAALAVLSELRAMGLPGAFVFPGNRRGKPIGEVSMIKLLNRLQAGVTVHGFRSAFRDWAGDETHFPREIAEAALAHQVGSAVERAYRRGSALEKRRQLMQAWADYATDAGAGSNVVALHG